MSRRSPTNERYQKYTGPKGQTRKSSAAAKPSRKSASGASSSTKAKAKSKSSAPRGKYFEPNTPEYAFWRRMWWISLGAGLALVAISFGIQYLPAFKTLSWSKPLGLVMLAFSYTGIIAAFLIDYRKLRPLRKGLAGAATPGIASNPTKRSSRSDSSADAPSDKSDSADTDDDA